jgi:hypothetical protein
MRGDRTIRAYAIPGGSAPDAEGVHAAACHGIDRTEARGGVMDNGITWEPHHKYPDGWNCRIDGKFVGGYMGGPEGGFSVYLPFVEITVSVPECDTAQEARNRVESLARRMTEIVDAWRNDLPAPDDDAANATRAHKG